MSIKNIIKTKKQPYTSLLRNTIGLLSTLFIVSIANGATTPVPILNPFSVEPGVIGRSISSTPSPFVTKPAPGFTPQLTEPAAINPEAAKISFILNKVVITGNHAYSDQELQAIFNPYIHHKISVADLQNLVQSVTDKYQNAGFFLSKAILPPQEIKNGVVQVRVLEGFISHISVQGIENPGEIRFIERYAKHIENSKPIKLADLEHYLLLMNDIPGFNIKSVLAPDPDVPLGSMLTLVTDHKTVEATGTQDNFQTRYLGPDETSLYTSINSLFIPGGTLYAHVLNADEHQKIRFYELRHDQVIGSHGLVLSVDGYSTRTNPQFILTPLEIFGSSDDANVVLSYPLLRSRQRTLSILGQFDYMNNSSTALGENLYNDKIRDVSFSALYNDILWKGEDTLGITFDKGLNILNANGPGFRSRSGAQNDFFKIMATVSRNQFLGNRFSIYALVTSQYSNSILPAAETFIFGGPYLGRGYDWAQFTGDEGVAGKIEFRVNTVPNFLFLNQVQYYAFLDTGKLWSLIPLVPVTSGTSAGFGARAAVMNHLNAEVFFGKPLTTPNATQVILGNSGHSFLGYFQISAYL